MSEIAIVANGAHDNIQWLTLELEKFSQIIGVDGGINALLECGISPTEVIGDFDTCIPPPGIPTHLFPIEKEQTDLALALEKYTCKQSVIVYGALGKNIDHELGNLLLLHSYPDTVEYRTDTTSIRCLTGTHTIKTIPKQRIGLFSLKGSAVVTTTGLRWDIKHATIDQTFYSISNYATHEKYTITLHDGSALLTRVNEKT